MSQIQTVPTHLGLILDGNRRWAKAHGLPSLEGHRKGHEIFKTISKAALKRGVKYVTAYVFSTENWNRSKEEVDFLMSFLLWVTKNEINEVNKEGIKLVFLGSRERLSKKILKAIEGAEEKTKNNNKGTIGLCFNYGGQLEITEAVQKIIAKNIKPEEVTAELIAKNLYHPDIPPVDLIIRTSGEQRISNFMLWRAAYSELYFTDKHWPDFTEQDLDTALAEYVSRQRRFGQ